MKFLYNTVLTILLPISLIAQTKTVLFIGNSYTGVNNLPTMTKDLALSLEDTLIVNSNTPGGTTFNSHTTNATSLAKIGQGTWDYVILQAQSQEPSFPPSQVATQTYPYAEILADSVRAANECTIPLFYMTWGRQNGDAGNCASYPVICDYEGMQGRLRESYLEMAEDNNAEVSPVGAAWKYVRDNHPSINLYSADESHPSASGSYLAACVHYASIFKKSPVGATYTFSLTAGEAAALQTAAKLIVIDSLANWNFRTDILESDFTSNPTTASGFDFTNTSANATDYFWDFGDGTTSNMENPSHTYNQAGNYNVMLIASNSCGTDTITQTVNPATDYINEQNLNDFKIRHLESELIINLENNTSVIISIYNIAGQIITRKSSLGNTVTLQSPKSNGIYFVTVTPSDSSTSITKKIIVH